MYKTKTNDELLKKYDPCSIGRRIFNRLNEIQLSMRDFETFLIRLFPAPFSSLRKFISYAEIKNSNRQSLHGNGFFERLGNFALSYALSMYATAMILKTDTYYLATGQEYKHFGSRLLLSENEISDPNARITDIQQSLASSFCLNECGGRLRICREIKNLTIKQLAEQIKISPSTVYAYENNNFSDPPRYSYPLLFKLSEALDVHTDYVVLGRSILDFYHIPDQQIAKNHDELLFNPPVNLDLSRLNRSLWEDMKIEAADSDEREEYIKECEQEYRDGITYILPLVKIDTLEKIRRLLYREFPEYEKDRFLPEDKRKYIVRNI